MHIPAARVVLGLALLALSTASLSAQLTVSVGGALSRGTIQTPYLAACGDDSEATAYSHLFYAGLGYGPVSLTAGYIDSRGGDESDCVLARPPAREELTRRVFERRMDALWGWMFDLRYSPERLPLIAHAGAGFEFEGNEMRSLGLALRTGGNLRVIGGVEVLQIRTPYVKYDIVRETGSEISRVEIGRGHAWRKFEALRLGLEYRLKLTRRTSHHGARE